ncbi:MAG: caspase family protein [Polyangiaceae bacterium]
MRFRLLLVLLLVFLGSVQRRALAAEVRKVAVVVGANLAPPGRVPLRYAHEDAQRVVEVLTSVGGFKPRDVQLLLDPAPAEVLAALDRELSAAGLRPEETLLFFYYSGHADERSIFPDGQALPFSALKSRLEDPRAKLRVGLLDSCRGGSWTGSKGLKKVDPFDVDVAPQLAEEGSVLIASSSGQESAHETEALQGSFFTHYWNAGLRGAADRGGDGIVTLNEAFEYARTLTIRDTALLGQEPQHPSFQMKLSGRRDVPLSTLANQHTTLLYDQTSGPTEVVRLNDGLVVVETSPGARRIRLGLPAGSYLVRRRSADGVFARIVALSAGGTTTLGEPDLTRSTLAAERPKGVDTSDFEGLTWTGQHAFGSLALGVRHAPVIDPGLRVGAADGRGVFLVRFEVRLLQHLWWAAPLALVFDAERPSALNWFVWGGVPVLSGNRQDGDGYLLAGFVGAGADARYHVSERHTVNASLSELGAFEWTQNPGKHRTWPETFTTQLTLGLSETIPNAVTFDLGVALSANLLVNGRFAAEPVASPQRDLVLAFGSVQRAGLRPLPLIHVPIGDGWGIDAYAVGAYVPSLKGWVETYLAGVSYAH